MAVENREFQIDDPEELSQKTRIRELLNRRTSVIDARDQASDAMTLGGADQQRALSFYRSRIESLILDLWTKFENEDLDAGEEYLKTHDIDTVIVPPPEEIRDDDLANGVSAPEPKEIPIRGLRWFIESDNVITAEFTVRSWKPPGERTVVGERAVPRRTLDKALVACMEFIDETGIDMDVRQDKGDHGFDYSDILENGPPGQADTMDPEEVANYGDD